MKKILKYYWFAWLIAVAVFHVILFLLPDTILNSEDSNFWIIYLTVLAGFLGQALCSYLYSKKEKKEERFLYIPVVLISYIALLMTLLLALQAITLQLLPDWFTIIVAVLVLAFYALSVIRTLAAAEMVIAVDAKVERQTGFIRALSVKAKSLEQSASTELRPHVKKVYEGLHYSDPVSSEELASIEEEISKSYETFAASVKKNEKETAEAEAQKLYGLIKERNELCKQVKR